MNLGYLGFVAVSGYSNPGIVTLLVGRIAFLLGRFQFCQSLVKTILSTLKVGLPGIGIGTGIGTGFVPLPFEPYNRMLRLRVLACKLGTLGL